MKDLNYALVRIETWKLNNKTNCFINGDKLMIIKVIISNYCIK